MTKWHFSLGFALRVHGVEIEPKVGGVRRLAYLVVLIADAVDDDLEKVGVSERHIEVRFKHSESGKSNDPVVEDTVFHLILVKFGEHIVQCDVKCLEEALLENVAYFEERQ